MEFWQILVAVLVGFALGLALSQLILHQRQLDKNAIVQAGKEAFAPLSEEALSRSIDTLVKLNTTQSQLGAKDLESKKALIDQVLEQMSSRLEGVKSLVQGLDKDRAQKFGELAKQLQLASEQTTELTRTTNLLHKALASGKARGQWGERMAEDVLRLAGFVENINYVKQKTIGSAGTRPDFTFNLPHGMKVNMDVKFPLDNYMRYLETESETDRARFRNAFLSDVKNQSKCLVGREYINPEQKTLDYVLMFIPNEQVYAFIQEQDSSIMDQAMAKRVIFCSPLTLFAILAVIRQAVDNFALEQKSDEMLTLLGQFHAQWDKFRESLEKMGNKIVGAHEEFERLSTTRTRQLEKPLEKLAQLRNERELPTESALNTANELAERERGE